jgi:rhamnose transport system ATP-binding protein
VEETAGLTEGELIRLMVGREVSTLYPPRAGKVGAPLLTLSGVGCRAAGIRDISFELRAGEVLGLAGLVGAGRTELAHIVFGLTPADAGRIELEGKPIRIDSPRAAVQAGIAYVPEDRRRHGVILELDLAANLSLAIHDRLFPRSWLRFGAERSLAGKMMRELAIKAAGWSTRAGELSGGNQQKVALGRWLASEPKVLVLDEPTQGVDVGAKAELHRMIRELAQRGLGILMISSDLPEILGMSDRIAVLRGGRLVAMLEKHEADAPSVMAAALGGN